MCIDIKRLLMFYLNILLVFYSSIARSNFCVKDIKRHKRLYGGRNEKKIKCIVWRKNKERMEREWRENIKGNYPKHQYGVCMCSSMWKVSRLNNQSHNVWSDNIQYWYWVSTILCIWSTWRMANVLNMRGKCDDMWIMRWIKY